MAFPALLLAVGLAVVVGAGLINVLVVIALFTWFYPARIVRNANAVGTASCCTSRRPGRSGPSTAAPAPRPRPAPGVGAAARVRDVDRRHQHPVRGRPVVPRRRRARRPRRAGARCSRTASTPASTASCRRSPSCPASPSSLTMLAFNLLGDGAARRARPEAAPMTRASSVRARARCRLVQIVIDHVPRLDAVLRHRQLHRRHARAAAPPAAPPRRSASPQVAQSSARTGPTGSSTSSFLGARPRRLRLLVQPEPPRVGHHLPGRGRDRVASCSAPRSCGCSSPSRSAPTARCHRAQPATSTGRVFAILGMSIPIFWVAPMLSYLLAYQPTQGVLFGLHILPVGTRFFPIDGYVKFARQPGRVGPPPHAAVAGLRADVRRRSTPATSARSRSSSWPTTTCARPRPRACARGGCSSATSAATSRPC